MDVSLLSIQPNYTAETRATPLKKTQLALLHKSTTRVSVADVEFPLNRIAESGERPQITCCLIPYVPVGGAERKSTDPTSANASRFRSERSKSACEFAGADPIAEPPRFTHELQLSISFLASLETIPAPTNAIEKTAVARNENQLLVAGC